MAKTLFAAVLVLLFALAGTATAAGDSFTGAWVATDSFDGSTLRLQIGAPSADGVRQVTATDDYASACGAPATATGTGTVSGTTLTAVLNVRCGGEPQGAATFTFTLANGTLQGFDSTFVPAKDPFTGSWHAIDPFDGSNLRLRIGNPSADGTRSVTLTDDFASACGAPATAIGTGTVSGSTLTAVLEVRCGGKPRGTGTFTYTLVGDTLYDGFSTFTR